MSTEHATQLLSKCQGHRELTAPEYPEHGGVYDGVLHASRHNQSASLSSRPCGDDQRCQEMHAFHTGTLMMSRLCPWWHATISRARLSAHLTDACLITQKSRCKCAGGSHIHWLQDPRFCLQFAPSIGHLQESSGSRGHRRNFVLVT